MASRPRGRSLMRSLCDELTCPVCLETFTDPRVLPCLHSLCLKCLESIILSSDSLENLLKCPTCCKEYPLPIQGATGLPKNFTLVSLLDLMNSHTQATDNDTSPVDREEVIGLIDSKPSVLFCSEHSAEMDSYCKDCRQVVCKGCVQTGTSHKGHVVDQVGSVRKGLVEEMRHLVVEVDMRVVELNEEMTSVIEADQESVSSCKASINEYFSNYEETVEAKIAKLKEKLTLSKKHQELLLEKLEKMSLIHNKNRAVDQDLIKQSTEDMNSLVASAKALMLSSDDAKVVCESEKVIRHLKTIANFKVDPACMQPTPVFSFSKTTDPLQSEVINPRSVVVEGLNKAKAGANSFIITMTAPLVKKARLRINITLPNGKKADPESIKFTPLAENCWSVAFYIPTGSFPLSGFLVLEPIKSVYE